ncbi:DNA ligase 4 [Anopheles nili]|uniref:DNA ligase 4 n=1 Tax=Anopheles nili TaxID=185578 RepID=UPI00237C42B5|nr:DNA ligase 4 [Anopheles nili]
MANWQQFSELTALLEKVKLSTKGSEVLLQKFYTAFESSRQACPQQETRSSIYPLLRLLVPAFDHIRKAYGLRERTLAEAYINALSLDRRSEEVQQLLTAGGSRDLADRLGPLLQGRCPAVGNLTIADVNEHLDQIGTGRQAARDALVQLIERGSSLDQRWIVRIVLRNLRLGVSNRRVLQLYHPSAPTLYDTTSDLRRVVELVESGDVPEPDGPAGQSGLIQLMHFVRPMLCQRVELNQVGELLRRGVYWLETKMDGERFQVHRNGDQFRYYSRNGHDYSKAFGATPDQLDGTLTPLLEQLLASTAREVILDGEMMVFDRRDLHYRDKCDGTDVKALRVGDANLRPCFCVYDVLYYNGRPLTGVPYAERARLLSEIVVREQVGFVQRCSRERVRDPEHLLELVNGAIDAHQEGVVLKREDAPYQPNRRAGTGWYKIKPDYIAGLVTDFDLLVLGGFRSRWRTSVNALLVGVMAPGGGYRSVARVSSGLGVVEWQQLGRTLGPHWRTEPVVGLDCGQTSPDMWIEPSVSLVLQLKGSELVRNDAYAAGYTIRFPRIVAIRPDKLPDEVCTLEELERLANTSSDVVTRKATKLAQRHVTIEDLDAPSVPSKSSRKRGALQLNNETVKPKHEPTPLPDGMLQGRDVCVMSGEAPPGSGTVEALEGLVRRHGGRPVANPSSNTYAIVAGRETFKVRKYMDTGRWDVVRPEWLLRAGLEGHLERFRPADMLVATEPTRTWLAERYDRYGDSYTRPVSPTSFNALLRQMGTGGGKGAEYVPLSEGEVLVAERALLGGSSRQRLFWGLTGRLFRGAEVDELLVEGYRNQRALLRFVRNGGRWLRDTEPGPAGYVFVGKGTITKDAIRWVREIESPTKNGHRQLILTTDWIGQSLEKGRLCDPDRFTLD